MFGHLAICLINYIKLAHWPTVFAKLLLEQHLVRSFCFTNNVKHVLRCFNALIRHSKIYGPNKYFHSLRSSNIQFAYILLLTMQLLAMANWLCFAWGDILKRLLESCSPMSFASRKTKFQTTLEILTQSFRNFQWKWNWLSKCRRNNMLITTQNAKWNT